MSQKPKTKSPSILIVYHYFPHYRLPVFRMLTAAKEFKISFLSGLQTDQNILTINPKLAKIPVDHGRLRWKFVRNLWFFHKIILWQCGLIKECAPKNFDGYIFLGNPYFLSTWVALIVCRLFKKTIPLGAWDYQITQPLIRIAGH